MRTVILHLGMNKAGSSSIQASLRGYDDGRIRYLRLGAPNHSKAISTLVMARPEQLNAYRIQGFSRERIQEEKRLFERRLAAELALEREIFVVSGEGIAELGRMDIEALQSLFAANGLVVRPIAYIREPVGFASSVFQQSVKFGGKEFVVMPPGYRNKFQKFLDLYGEGGVEFVEFARGSLRGGSVVADFAARIGAGGPVEDAWVNERLAPEAVALLYFWNRESTGGAGSKTIVDARREVIRLLENGFAGRFRLGPKALAAALDPPDIAWMEEKAGFALAPDGGGTAGTAEDGVTVDGHDDLAALREASREGLVALLDAQGVASPREAGTSQLLDLLLGALMAGTASPQRPAPAIAAPPAKEPQQSQEPRQSQEPPEGVAEALAQALFRVARQGGSAGRWADQKDARLADAAALVKELAANGVRFTRTP